MIVLWRVRVQKAIFVQAAEMSCALTRWCRMVDETRTRGVYYENKWSLRQGAAVTGACHKCSRVRRNCKPLPRHHTHHEVKLSGAWVMPVVQCARCPPLQVTVTL